MKVKSFSILSTVVGVALTASVFGAPDVAKVSDRPDPPRQAPVFAHEPDPTHVFLRDCRSVPYAATLGNALTAELVFVPRPDDPLPPGPLTDNGQALLNIGSGYYDGFRLLAKEGLNGQLMPVFQIGRPKPVGAISCEGTHPFVPGVTNQVIVTWNGEEATLFVNGREAGRAPCAAKWTKSAAQAVLFGFTGYGLNPLAQNVLRVRLWNRALSSAEVAAENYYAHCPRPREMDAAELAAATFNGYLESSGVDIETFDRRVGDIASLHPAVRRLCARARDELLICAGRKPLAWGAIAADDGRPRHHPVPPAPEPGARLFVSPSGDDNAPGTFERPFKTLAAAQRKVREIRLRGLPKGGIAVYLREGMYPVTETLALTAEDSGSPGSPVVWRAWKDECAVLDGGFTVPPLAPVTDAQALARIPSGARGKVLCVDVRAASYDALEPLAPYGFHITHVGQRHVNLYCDGRPLALARQPNAGWYRVGDDSRARERMFKAEGVSDLGVWTKEREPELMAMGYWKFLWGDQTVEVDAVDPKSGRVKIRDRCDYTEMKKGHPFRFVNALAAVDEPGEWFLDRRAGKLYVYPPQGTTSDSHYVLTRFGEPFASLENAHDIRLEGLVFQYGRRHALVMKNVTGIVFAGNLVRRFGGDGLRAEDIRQSLLADNVFHSFGHTACVLTSGDRRTLTPGGLVVANNEFSDTGRAQRTYTPGLSVSGVAAEVVHNHFHDIPSSAIAPGGNDLYIGWNLVERVVTESDDQGGIDMFGHTDWAGIRMAWNVWRDIGGSGDRSFVAGRAGIRLDDAISGMSIYGNRFLNCSRGGFGGVNIHGGRLNEVENNLFADGFAGVSIGVWPLDRWKAYFERKYVQNWLTKDVDVRKEPYASHYPHMKTLVDMPMSNRVCRNVFANVEQVFFHPPLTGEYAGNIHCVSAAEAEETFASSTFLRPLPPLSSIGPYETPLRRRVLRADAEFQDPTPRWIDVIPSGVASANPLADGVAVIFWLVPQGNPAVDRASEQLKDFRKIPGVKTGVLLQCTLGHGVHPPAGVAETPWQRMGWSHKGWKGYKFCPLDLRFRDYIARQCRLIAAAKPDFFMIDDDVRLEDGCRCPLHLAAYEKVKDRKSWAQFSEDTLADYVRLVREAFPKEIPGMFCCVTSTAREGARMARIAAGEGHRPALRVGGAPYWNDGLFDMLAMRGLYARQREIVADAGVDLLMEADTCPHVLARTSATRYTDFLQLVALEGLNGAKMWITPTTGAKFESERESHERYAAALRRDAAAIRYLASARVRNEGVKIVLGAKAAPMGVNDWGRNCLGRQGIAYRYGKWERGDVVAVTGEEVKYFSDAELTNLVSGALLLDQGAKAQFVKRGFGAALRGKNVAVASFTVKSSPRRWSEMQDLAKAGKDEILTHLRRIGGGRVPGGAHVADYGSYHLATGVDREGRRFILVDNLDLDIPESLTLAAERPLEELEELRDGSWRAVEIVRLPAVGNETSVRIAGPFLPHRPRLFRCAHLSAAEKDLLPRSDGGCR